jgi:hypothetical protein
MYSTFNRVCFAITTMNYHCTFKELERYFLDVVAMKASPFGSSAYVEFKLHHTSIIPLNTLLHLCAFCEHLNGLIS